MQSLFDIIHEDADFLVVHKPADLVCHPTKGDQYSSLISRARIYLQGHGGTSVPSPHLVNRLDRETSGLVLIAKNSTAARELGKIWETRAVCKEYLAIVYGHVSSDHGIIDAPLGKDQSSRVVIQDCVRPDGAPAQTEYVIEKRFLIPTAINANSEETHQSASDQIPSRFSLVHVHPLTGRKHQIRIHLAHLGHPIVGDKLYGGDPDLYLALVEKRLTPGQRARLILPHQALHASRLQFDWRGKNHDFAAQPEAFFTAFIASGQPV